MQLKTYKTLWGNTLPIAQACLQAKETGFDGVEGKPPQTLEAIKLWQDALSQTSCDFILEIVTGEDYVPNLSWTMQQHLSDIEAQIQTALPLEPRFATLMTGSDAWSESQSIDFFGQAMQLGEKYGMTLSFETHRSRCLFNPWVTERIADALPEMKLTLDMSHWCVVCERLLSLDVPSLRNILPKIYHIHARVGYAQGPQVPHPASPEYQDELQTHQSVWEQVWLLQQAQGRLCSTLTPEFGPDGYCHLLPFTQAPVADIWEINQWMGQIQRQHFNQVFN